MLLESKTGASHQPLSVRKTAARALTYIAPHIVLAVRKELCFDSNCETNEFNTCACRIAVLFCYL